MAVPRRVTQKPARSLLRALFGVLLTASILTYASADDLKLWYDKPATNWEREALPIGNGRLAAMIYGGVPEEHIQFNEESFWIGDEKESGSYQNAGDLYVKFDHGPAESYRRELTLGMAYHDVSYEVGGRTFKRIAFGCRPCECAGLRLFRLQVSKA